MLGKVIDNIRVAWTSLLSNKLRGALTILGITIGISSVVVLVSIGQAVETFVVDEFNRFGSNYIMIFGAENRELEGPPSHGSSNEQVDYNELLIPLTTTDADMLANPFNVPDALHVSSTLMVVGQVEYEEQVMEAPQIVGTDTEYFKTIDLEMAHGRSFTEDDIEAAHRVAIIGVKVVEELFDNGYALNRVIRVNGVRFTVVGLLEEIPGGDAADADNSSVIVPITTAQRRLNSNRTDNGDYPVTTIVVQARDAQSVNDTVQQIRQTLRDTHNIKPDEEDDFIIFSSNQIVDTLQTITEMLTYFLAAIAGISLLVGGIGIMNIMLVSVSERTKEIGLRKAVGAQKSDILLQFLTESVALSLFGGLLGTLLAISAGIAATALIPDLTVIVGAPSIVIATLISFSIGAFFGVYPANRAASMNPIDALRHE